MSSPINKSDYMFFSVDVETTGTCPANGELCSIGAEAIRADTLESAGLWAVNLKFTDPENYMSDPVTMQWWEQFPIEWDTHRQYPVRPYDAALKFQTWVNSFDKQAVFVAWPVAFDFAWITDLFVKFTFINPFGYSPMCLKNYTLGLLGKPLALLGHREEAAMPEHWIVESSVPHVAIYDAIAQGQTLRHILTSTNW